MNKRKQCIPDTIKKHELTAFTRPMKVQARPSPRTDPSLNDQVLNNHVCHSLGTWIEQQQQQ